MSNIPYPDVPPLPGVPPISRLASQGLAVGLAVAAELYAIYLALKNKPKVYPKQANQFSIWGILYAKSFNPNNPTYAYTYTNTNTATIITSPFSTPITIKNTGQTEGKIIEGEYALEPDSFVNFEYKVDHKIPNYPIQNGSFASYNKIALPYEIKIRVTKKGISNISSFINQILILLNSVQILAVVTPDRIYNSVNLIHFDYKKEAVNGATLLIADLTFEEVRVVVSPSVPTATPNGAGTISNGQVSTNTSSAPISEPS